MIINGHGGYGLLAAYIGGPAAQVSWLGPKVGGPLAPFLYSSREPSELSKWLCYDGSTINIVVVIIISSSNGLCRSSYAKMSKQAKSTIDHLCNSWASC